MYNSLKIIHSLRRIINRHPRVVWFLADLIRRMPWLERYLTQRYSIRLPVRQAADLVLLGYRFPLATTQDQLLNTDRDVLKKLT
ncbi:hypothetical protein HUU61_21010 [Rhodopseudomonas palustris]|uniref:Uncharacterized protein n=1 Tax=Thiospirillum jenense TaxID=1653858 RepID=A0A839HEC6_9GAMM|nr:hypothetical protein [Thiospirillum jenense]MBB1093760.1 hypothetical protein [Rhodopseudomonas palustris]MBB1127233.1 hypothetical protein [Thiospirillum jenense]